jgi:DNA-binding transcriptional MocR family regulator
MSFTSYDVSESDELGRSAATVLSYIRRWLPYAKVTQDGKPWVWRTLEAISEDLGISKRTVQRSIALLIERGLLLKERLWQHAWKSVCFYTIPGWISQDSQGAQAEPDKMATSNKTEAKQQYPSKKKEIPDFRALARKTANKVAQAVGFAPPPEPAKTSPEVIYVNGRTCVADDWTDYTSHTEKPALSAQSTC